MEQARIEMAVVEETIVAAAEAQARELSELEVVLVGGGVGEITPF